MNALAARVMDGLGRAQQRMIRPQANVVSQSGDALPSQGMQQQPVRRPEPVTGPIAESSEVRSSHGTPTKCRPDFPARHANHTPGGALGGGSSHFLYTRHRVLSASLTPSRRPFGPRCLSPRTRQVSRGPLRASAPFPVRAALCPRGFRPGRRRAIGVGFGYSRSSGGRVRGSTASSPQVSARKPPRRTRFARERSPGAAAARASHADCKE